MTITSETEKPGAFRQVVHIDQGGHTVFADTARDAGGGETAPGPHDLFDASLATCKALTAHWYARQKNIPLEGITVTVTRDDTQERAGKYNLAVTLDFHGTLTPDQRTRLHDIAGRCPVHRLMTTAEITITTAPLEAT